MLIYYFCFWLETGNFTTASYWYVKSELPAVRQYMHPCIVCACVAWSSCCGIFMIVHVKYAILMYLLFCVEVIATYNCLLHCICQGCIFTKRGQTLQNVGCALCYCSRDIVLFVFISASILGYLSALERLDQWCLAL